MKNFTCSDGSIIPALGMGTWNLGEGKRPAREEEAALQAGIEAGIRLIDTAEMYGDGSAERLIGRVLKHTDRDKLYLVSKVYPWNAGKSGIFQACENSLRRLGTDRLDCYLLHWPGNIPIAETVECLETLKQDGKILHWGVSNFDLEDMQALISVPNGENCILLQDLYHLASRGMETVLMPWLKSHSVVPMAYCPLGHSGQVSAPQEQTRILNEIASEFQITTIQVQLAFLLHRGMVAIPMTASVQHAIENAAAEGITLTESAVERLEKAFPFPKERVPLDIL